MITNYEELTGEQFEVLREIITHLNLTGRGMTFGKGSTMFKRLVSVGLGKSTVSELNVRRYNLSKGKKRIRVESPRLSFARFEVDEEQHDQLIGVI